MKRYFSNLLYIRPLKKKERKVIAHELASDTERMNIILL